MINGEEFNGSNEDQPTNSFDANDKHHIEISQQIHHDNK